MYPCPCGVKCLIILYVVLLLLALGIHALQSDIDCLKSVKESLEDPLGYLHSWNFNNNTEGFICRFNGVDCWHPDENKVLNIRLSNMGLGGLFPLGIQTCLSLTGLDLSRNRLKGTIPWNITKMVGWITTLDLSSNQFSGEIPVGLANCTYLNVVKLDNNKLTGQIPPQFGLLTRIKDFSVANNRLIGPVPHFGNYSIPAENVAYNEGLCGAPLPDCPLHVHAKKDHLFLTGFVTGWAIFVLLTLFIYVFGIPYAAAAAAIGKKNVSICPEQLEDIGNQAMLITRKEAYELSCSTDIIFCSYTTNPLQIDEVITQRI
ncbi:PREDICTED: probably inactive leucine-rich repeat receptor-like protein kinase At5g48380 [Ipomoea nil]|uniref:probably inactive leucine-rich repeat receptor-like protein kinase At5g48380 n=1 Tax=Ipomoea nil TaxID=35883 RepID=UPI000900EFF3|nr:PREDICTED: probably inactive leucine-rich repeat receptor-like protein kinase At5g48380 [Ipomoea nil]